MENSNNQTDKTDVKVNIEEFLTTSYNGRIALLSTSNYRLICRPFVVFLHHFKRKGAELKVWTDTLYDLSLEYPKTVQFCIMDFEDALLFHLSWNDLNRLQNDTIMRPFVFAVDINEHQHDFDEEFTFSALIMFCKYLEKNTLYYSDDIDLYGPFINVQVIVADNFRELVEQSEKDVFVTLHSKYSLYNELDLQNIPSDLKAFNDTLVFYAINANTNYIPLEYRVSELPTSFLILAKNKTKRLRYVHKYNDGLEIMRFITKHTNISLSSKEGGYYGMPKTKISSHNEKLQNILVRLDVVSVNTRQKNLIFEDGFLKFLDSILQKVNDTERQKIEMEIVTILLNRLNKK